MAAPKPWETPVPMSSQPILNSFNAMNHGFGPIVEQGPVQGSAPTPPPPPPRMVQQQMGLYPPTNYLSPYSLGPYQTGGFYNSYRVTPYGAQSNLPVSNFAQLAMDESRIAFSSIESVIHTFRSISWMLESTFTSVYSSFRALTDVLDQFTRLRTELAAIYPLVLLWKFLKYLYHRILRLLRLRQTMPGNTEETWSAIYSGLQQNRTNLNTQMTTSSSSSLSSSSFLVGLFFIISFGTPMLMLKFINSIIKRRQAANNWLEKDTNQPRVVALYDYVARNPDELSFKRGTAIYLAPYNLQSTTSNWFLGTVDRVHAGLIPANYVQPIRQPTNSSIMLRPQTPLDATSAISSPQQQSTSAVSNTSQSNYPGEEEPTLS